MACIVGPYHPSGYERRLAGLSAPRRGYLSYGPASHHHHHLPAAPYYHTYTPRGCLSGLWASGYRPRAYLADPYLQEERLRRLEDEVDRLRRDQYRTTLTPDDLAYFLRRLPETWDYARLRLPPHQRGGGGASIAGPHHHHRRRRCRRPGGDYVDGYLAGRGGGGGGNNQAIVGRGNAPVNVNIRNGADRGDEDDDDSDEDDDDDGGGDYAYDPYRGVDRPYLHRPRFGRRY